MDMRETAFRDLRKLTPSLPAHPHSFPCPVCVHFLSFYKGSSHVG